MQRLTAGVAALALLLVVAACDKGERSAAARRVATRTDLIGGPSALGEVGDFLLENDKIRVIIQDKGFSRGFGVYGGSLIDADRVRPMQPGDVDGGHGRDVFGEFFPVAFFEALVAEDVEVLNDGADGAAAVVRVSGYGGEFLSLTRTLNHIILNSHELPDSPLDALNVENLDGAPKLRYQVDYAVSPGKRFVDISVRLENLTDAPLIMPSEPGKLALGFLGIAAEGFKVPLGFVLLFGGGNDVFSPGSGFDIRFALEDAYAAGSELKFPALPGLLTPALVTTNPDGVSYGLFAAENPCSAGFVAAQEREGGDNAYEQAYGVAVNDDTLLVPFLASSFTGVFASAAPNVLAANPGPGVEVACGGPDPIHFVEFSARFVVGDGDVASVLDVYYEESETPTATFAGKVLDALSAQPVEGASVLVYPAEGGPINQLFTDGAGQFKGQLPPGRYRARIELEPMLSDFTDFEITADGVYLMLSAPTAGRISVHVRDDVGQRLPAKVTVVGTVAAEDAGRPTKEHLFDLVAGQRWRKDDMVPDNPDDPTTRRYIEKVDYTHDGQAVLRVPPGDWLVYTSRGSEYSLNIAAVSVAAGATVDVVSKLRRVVDTTNYISGDFHLHASPSLDSDLDLHDRVRSVVGEGVELLVATDHNFITDYAPYLSDLGLEAWANTMIGIELTTLESGHFNGFPIRRDISSVTRGSFEWSLLPPDDVFGAMRALGSLGKENTIVQINHPRDTMLGYFTQYEMDPLMAVPPEPPDCTLPAALDNLAGCAIPNNGPAFRDADGLTTFSYDFDAIEVLNGSVIGQLHHTRMPRSVAGLDIPDEIRAQLPDPGAILCEGGTVAFTGVIDDWFNLLNLDPGGRRYIGIGGSDSHGLSKHTGYPRTYLYVGHDDPRGLDDQQVVDAIRSRRVLMTNGPFVEIFVNGTPMGGEVKASGGSATLEIKIQSPPWNVPDTGIVWVNGQERERFPITLTDGRADFEFTLGLERDSWVVVEVTGAQSLFPIVEPENLPPILLGEAFAAIAGPIGLGGSDLGPLEPARSGVFTPIALTNPIWITVDGGEWTAPGATDRECEGLGVVDHKSARLVGDEIVPVTKRANPLKASFGFPRLKGEIRDVRVLFEQFGRHAH